MHQKEKDRSKNRLCKRALTPHDFNRQRGTRGWEMVQVSELGEKEKINNITHIVFLVVLLHQHLQQVDRECSVLI